MAAQRKRRVQKADPTEVVIQGTNLRFEAPKSKRKPKPNPAAVVVQEINPVSGFTVFLREYAVVTVAIGFAIATQAQSMIKQFTTSFIDPAYALLLNGQALSQKTMVVTWHEREQVFAWGSFVYSLLNFLFMLVIIYAVVKFFALDKLQQPKPKDKKEVLKSAMGRSSK